MVREAMGSGSSWSHRAPAGLSTPKIHAGVPAGFDERSERFLLCRAALLSRRAGRPAGGVRRAESIADEHCPCAGIELEGDSRRRAAADDPGPRCITAVRKRPQTETSVCLVVIRISDRQVSFDQNNQIPNLGVVTAIARAAPVFSSAKSVDPQRYSGQQPIRKRKAGRGAERQGDQRSAAAAWLQP